MSTEDSGHVDLEAGAIGEEAWLSTSKTEVQHEEDEEYTAWLDERNRSGEPATVDAWRHYRDTEFVKRPEVGRARQRYQNQQSANATWARNGRKREDIQNSNGDLFEPLAGKLDGVLIIKRPDGKAERIMTVHAAVGDIDKAGEFEKENLDKVAAAYERRKAGRDEFMSTVEAMGGKPTDPVSRYLRKVEDDGEAAA